MVLRVAKLAMFVAYIRFAESNIFTETSILCPPKNECHITCCNSKCNQRQIFCPANNQCYIDCYEQGSCSNTQILATESSQLNIHCNQAGSCNEMSIHCPNSTAEHQCNLQSTDKNSNITIYAINGWSDVGFGNSTYLNGKMYCKSTYTSQCTFDTSKSLSQCTASNLECNAVDPDQITLSTSIKCNAQNLERYR